MSPDSFLTPCPHCGASLDAGGNGAGTELTCPHCGGTFLHHAAFGRYRLERRLGSGGMGTIFLSHDTVSGQPVAVKILHPHRSADPRWVEIFLREAEVTARLNHPAIVRILDAGWIGTQPFLVMEPVEGQSLERRLEGGSLLSEEEALNLAGWLASALHVASQHGLVHRDIKPGNILFGLDGAPKLVDFDLCREANLSDEGDTPVWGTPFYMPPERLHREPEDARSDMYSLGATLYHALAGRPPYLEADPAKVVQSREEGPPPPLREAAPAVSEATARIVDRCLAAAPADRYASYDELLEALDAAKADPAS